MITIIDPATRDLTPDTFDSAGRFRILSADYWRTTTQPERSALCVRHAMYCLPTIELVERLRQIIDGRSAIEIGAGNGVLAAALGIPATDNRMQDIPKYRAQYELMRQPTITYGDNVEELDARDAVRQHRPRVVIAAWVTHKYDPRRHWAGGNEMGVTEERIIDGVETYVMVGNLQVHKDKSIWSREHTLEHPDYLFSRAANGTRDFIAQWQGASLLLKGK